MISFVSTRRKSEPVSLGTAVLRGLAPDGGLYVPTQIPSLLSERVHVESDVDAFAELAEQMLSPWMSGWLSSLQVEQLARRVFTFPVPLVPLGADGGLYMLELFHGPTLSFKDFGARLLGGLLGYLQQESEQETVVLVATSGDTGSAVADGCSGIDGVRVVILYPEGGVSPTQELQLTLRRSGVTPVCVRGSFDDCQRLVKGAFAGPVPSHIRLTTANSINVGRLLAQTIYYVHAARTLRHGAASTPDPVFCVPSGNLGNLTAGMMAFRAGMPANGFIAAHNANDFFPSWLSDEGARFAPSVKTLSNAMDVGAPSNFERLEYLFDRTELKRLVRGVRVSDRETIEEMRATWEETGYVPDPHTAVALRATRGRSDGAPPVVVLATAHPAKFPETVKQATGVAPDTPERLATLASAAHYAEQIDADQEELTRLLSA